MSRSLQFLFSGLIVLFLKRISCSTHLKGATELDSFTFDKMLSKFKVALVKFDQDLPYGEKEEQYGRVAEFLRFSPDILVAEVGLREYGQNRNIDLADRYGVKYQDIPVIKLFVRGKSEPVTFAGTLNADIIKTFVKTHAGIRVVLDHCLQEFDELAEQFMDTNKKGEKMAILETAEQLAKTLVREEQIKSAGVYIKMMHQVINKGSGMITREMDRAKRGVRGRISYEQRDEMQGVINILQSFRLKQLKDEL